LEEIIVINPLEVAILEQYEKSQAITKSWSNVYHVMDIIESLECVVGNVIIVDSNYVRLIYRSKYNIHEVDVWLNTGGR
jgi:hypothetical protein